MKKIIFILIILLIPSFAYSDTKNYGGLYNVEYVRNYDGDTITFNIPNIHPLFGDKISIRVYGIDAPEIRGKCPLEKAKAKRVKTFVRDFLINAKNITLRETQRGKYFRILAKVEADGKDLTETLINNGLAVPYFGSGQKHDWCK